MSIRSQRIRTLTFRISKLEGKSPEEAFVLRSPVSYLAFSGRDGDSVCGPINSRVEHAFRFSRDVAEKIANYLPLMQDYASVHGAKPPAIEPVIDALKRELRLLSQG